MKKHQTDKHTTSGIKNGVSSSALFFGAGIIALVGFVAGTRSDDLRTYVAPLFGIKTSSERLDLSSVQDTYQRLVANYDGEVDAQKLIDGANKGLVEAAGDTYTTYLTKSEAEELTKDLNGDVGAGIGAIIGVRNGQPVISKVLDDNPASSAGLKMNDVIVEVNGDSTVGSDADATASKIRGEAGTTVKIGVKREGERKDFTVTRAVINNPSVVGEIRNGVGVLTISRFDNETGVLARKEAERFVREDVKGVVVDVRSDGGGYLEAAVDTASLWLDDKLVVTQRTDGEVVDKQVSSSNAILGSVDTVVLVNGGTASASEILALALKDHDKATIVGEKTFGKGSVQEILPLQYNDALLKVTVAKWYSPNGVNINKKGIEPSTKIKLTQDDINAGRDPQLQKAIDLVK